MVEASDLDPNPVPAAYGAVISHVHVHVVAGAGAGDVVAGDAVAGAAVVLVVLVVGPAQEISLLVACQKRIVRSNPILGVPSERTGTEDAKILPGLDEVVPSRLPLLTAFRIESAFLIVSIASVSRRVHLHLDLLQLPFRRLHLRLDLHLQLHLYPCPSPSHCRH